MPVDVDTGKHFPKSREFQFDEEVALVFDNMAVRSIPGYTELHDALRDITRQGIPRGTIIDIGVSTGKGLTSMRPARQDYATTCDLVGIDNSEPMLDRAGRRVPEAKLLCEDITEGIRNILRGYNISPRCSVIIFGWVLQFIKNKQVRYALIREAYDLLESGGYLFVMEKFKMRDPKVERVLSEQYINWRLNNGYSREEIDAKTEALKHSMFPWTPQDLEQALIKGGFTKPEITPLFQRFVFGAYAARKL